MNTKMTIKCKQCGAEFHTTPSRIKNGKGKFCSKVCYTNYQHGQDIANAINHHCVICGKGMHLTPYLRRMNRECCSYGANMKCKRKKY